MKRIGVVLSGCGFKDGAEIREAVLALLALDRAGVEVVCAAPDIDQAKVVNHVTGQVVAEHRNVLVESARIARGRIRPLSDLSADDIDGLVLPGGFGAANNLSTFATEGSDAVVEASLRDLIVAVHRQRKPIGAICIAPAVVARVLGSHGVKVTIGMDGDTARAIEATGARHERCPVEGIVVDPENRVVSTPAYMYDAPLRAVAAGIELCVAEVLRMV
ncbi:MAG: isoprenoid biosynthesis glyoxalase ElbB [Deltaproteobacteria bacterium]|nr:isoprenoid biosynthesis glyoxalase ElbB [Deltaproteobacteria bacterium]